jgi:hypothetical protein
MNERELLALVETYVHENIGTFHDQRLASLDKVDIRALIKRKNPYLFRAKNLVVISDIVKALLDAHLSSSEETMFGNWLEQLSIFVCEKAYNGRKSGITGIDLEMDRDHIRYIVSIKSGPNWGNSSQIKKMINDFAKAKKTLQTSNAKLAIQAVNGCCYGKTKDPNKGDYLKYCGQDFWAFISGSDTLYINLIEPLGKEAKIRNDDFENRYGALLNRLTAQFTRQFCNDDYTIDWHRLLEYNSGRL